MMLIRELRFIMRKDLMSFQVFGKYLHLHSKKSWLHLMFTEILLFNSYGSLYISQHKNVHFLSFIDHQLCY